MTPVIRLLRLGGEGLVCVPLWKPTIFARLSLDLSSLASIKLLDFASVQLNSVDSNPQ